MEKIIKEYLVDILINVGVWILSFNFIFPEHSPNRYLAYIKPQMVTIMLGIVIFTLGIDILVRRYLNSKKS